MNPSVTQVLGKYMDWSAVNPDVLDAAADRGTRVHTYCATYAKGLFAVVPAGCDGYCRSFRAWFDDMVVEVVAVEVELEDPVQGYKGHPDLIAVLRGDKKPSLLDLKTPLAESKLWPAQVAAYKHLAKKYDVQRVASVRLRSDGSRALFNEYTSSAQDLRAFFCALYAHKYFLRR